MSEKKVFRLPAKRPGKVMKDVIDAGQVDGIQIEDKRGKPIAHLPLRFVPGKLIPRVFNHPLRATAVAFSTLARLVRVKMSIWVNDEEIE